MRFFLTSGEHASEQILNFWSPARFPILWHSFGNRSLPRFYPVIPFSNHFRLYSSATGALPHTAGSSCLSQTHPTESELRRAYQRSDSGTSWDSGEQKFLYGPTAWHPAAWLHLQASSLCFDDCHSHRMLIFGCGYVGGCGRDCCRRVCCD